jgi:prophage regulatory protein
MTRARYLRIADVLEKTGLSRRTIYRKMGNGTFPKSVKLSDSAVGWPEEKVNAWLESPEDWKEAA